MYCKKLQEGPFPVVCMYTKLGFELTLNFDAVQGLGHHNGLVDVVFGQAEYSFLSPPLGPFLTVPLGPKRLIKQLVRSCSCL